MYSVSTNVIISYPDLNFFSYFTASRTSWSAWGMFGYYPMLCIYIFKNIVTFFIETLMNVISLILFKRHLANKATLVGPRASLRKPTERSDVRQTVSSVVTQTRIITNPSRVGDDQSSSGSGGGSAGGKNMANLVLMKSVTGFIHNVALTTQSFYYLMNPKPTVTLRIIQFSAYFATTTRHAMNFVQFYFFNTNFRKEANLVFSKCHLNNRNRVLPSVAGDSVSLNNSRLR
jgi:hypothetical protein